MNPHNAHPSLPKPGPSRPEDRLMLVLAFLGILALLALPAAHIYWLVSR